MYSLDTKIVEARLAVVKSIKESDDSLELIDVILNHQSTLDALGKQVQHHINKLYNSYVIYGCTFDEFYDDMIEWVTRSGFVYEDDLSQDTSSFEIRIGIDHEHPLPLIQLTIGIVRSR